MSYSGIFYGPPEGYITPSFPSLFIPFDSPIYLYSPYDIWIFTLIWSFILILSIYSISGSLYLVFFTRKHLRLSVLAFLFHLVWGGLSALLSATVVGYAIAAIYQAAFLRMNTFIPLLLAILQTLVIISTSLKTFQATL